MRIPLFTILIIGLNSCTSSVLTDHKVTIQLITDLEEVNKLSTCKGDMGSDRILLLKVTNHSYDKIKIPLGNWEDGMWYSPEAILYWGESLSGDTLFSDGMSIVDAFSDREDLLLKNEIEYYCIRSRAFIEKNGTRKYRQFKFPYYIEDHKSPEHTEVLIKFNTDNNKIKRFDFTIPSNTQKGEKVRIDKNREVIIY